MKIAVAIYHSEAHQYPRAWIKQCLDSLARQSIFSQLGGKRDTVRFYELDYGKTEVRLFTSPFYFEMGQYYRRKECINYAAAMNEIYSWILQEEPTTDAIANVNIDDCYRTDRLQRLVYWLEEGYDIASSNYTIIDEAGFVKRVTDFAELDVAAELASGNNIVSNPCHLMKRRVFEHLQFDPTLVPVEDLKYWQDCIAAGFKIKIDPNCLHFRREHPGQEGNKKPTSNV